MNEATTTKRSEEKTRITIFVSPMFVVWRGKISLTFATNHNHSRSTHARNFTTMFAEVCRVLKAVKWKLTNDEISLRNSLRKIECFQRIFLEEFSKIPLDFLMSTFHSHICEKCLYLLHLFLTEICWVAKLTENAQVLLMWRWFETKFLSNSLFCSNFTRVLCFQGYCLKLIFPYSSAANEKCLSIWRRKKCSRIKIFFW